MKDLSKFENKCWEQANEIFNSLTEIEYAIIERESLVHPGLMIGTPIKIVQVSPPVTSFRNSNLPYIKVHVELPNGETRNISGEVLVKATKNLFDKFKELYNNVIVQYPTISKNI